MPQELKLIIKGLKPYQDKHTGKDIEPISGLPIFPEETQMADVAHFHNKKAYLYTEEEHLRKQVENPTEALSTVGESLRTILMTVKDLEVEWNTFMKSQIKKG